MGRCGQGAVDGMKGRHIHELRCIVVPRPSGGCGSTFTRSTACPGGPSRRCSTSSPHRVERLESMLKGVKELVAQGRSETVLGRRDSRVADPDALATRVVPGEGAGCDTSAGVHRADIAVIAARDLFERRAALGDDRFLGRGEEPRRLVAKAHEVIVRLPQEAVHPRLVGPAIGRIGKAKATDGVFRRHRLVQWRQDRRQRSDRRVFDQHDGRSPR